MQIRPVHQFLSRLFKTMASIEKPKVVFVLGGPGAGKGTQCENIVREFGFAHLSAGDLLRAERNTPNTKYGELIEHHIKNGSIVPVEITCKLIESAMEQSPRNKFLIDGFPRNQNNLDGWNKEMADKVNLLFVLFFDCPLEVCVQRCLKRGAEGSGRSDDNEESLKKRISIFNTESVPIIKHYEAQNLVRRIEADKSPESVFLEIRKIFNRYSKKVFIV